MKTPKSLWAGLCALVVMLSATACAGGRGDRTGPFDRASPAVGTAQFIVENRNFNDLRLSTVTTRGRRSLGMVPGAGSRTFRIEWPQIDEVAFHIQVQAGDNYTTPPITVSPGDRIELDIPERIRSLVIRKR